MRLVKTKYYFMSKQRKDSFGSWIGKPEISIVTGHKAQNERPYIVEQFNPAFMAGQYAYELEDGHIKGFRPRTTNVRTALDFLDSNKFSQVFVSAIK